MTRVTLDATAAAKLRGLQQVAELCDESGQLVGLFTPAVDHSIYDNVEEPFSREELDRFEKEPGSRPLKEILDDLQGQG